MNAADVRAEIASLLNGRTGEGSAAPAANGAQRVAKPADVTPTAAKATKAPVKASAAPPSKSKGKKR
jgi:hypothetical protein